MFLTAFTTLSLNLMPLGYRGDGANLQQQGFLDNLGNFQFVKASSVQHQYLTLSCPVNQSGGGDFAG